MRGQASDRVCRRRKAAEERASGVAELSALHTSFKAVRSARRMRLQEARLLEVIMSTRKAWSEAEAEATERVAPLEVEASALRARLKSRLVEGLRARRALQL